MCERRGEEPEVITVTEKTDRIKYEILRFYYTEWNKITHPNERVIVDGFAGSGHVDLVRKEGGITKRSRKPVRIYGSPLLAVLKTLYLSNNLTIVLNESNPKRARFLNRLIEDVKERGLPICEHQQKTNG